ncbi:AraC family transcriptional regulator [Sphingobacterium siyangense]|uniref:helix-turn-helix domain-containing protein n=1 Tax=Sphingobacterium siyangense TaxID=459529 RepID=UPI002FD87D35
MVTSYKKFDLFGKTVIQKVDFKSPFKFVFPIAEQSCFLYMLKGQLGFQNGDTKQKIEAHRSLLLNCLTSGKQIQQSRMEREGEIIIVSFHPDILKMVYDREIPPGFKSDGQVTNKNSHLINNDFLIQKYIEGLLFYFENPSLVNDELLVLKLKEIILLLAQTKDAEHIQVILSQLFPSTAYSFKQIIEANLFLQLGIGELAQKTNLSISSFKREFKKLYNDSPASYIKTKKLERAAELLVASSTRITDIAFDCGFNDLANFTKSFHERYKQSPTNYRLKFRGE